MRNFSHLNLEDSATVSINSRILEMNERGERIFNLSAGEPTLPTHSLIAEAVQRAIASGKTGYPPVAGIPALRAAAAEWINRWYESSYTADETLVVPGGKFGIFAACQALLERGDEVVILSPYWVSYPSIVKLFGGVPVVVETKESQGWQTNIEAIQSALTERTKMIILNSGVNPTGAVYERSFLEAVLILASERGIIIVSDEVYSGLTYEGEYVSCGSFPEYRESVIVINSCSKNFAMTGWRVGFVFAPEVLITVLTKLQGQSTSGASTISQYAALGALQHAREVNVSVLSEMKKRRDVFVEGLRELLPSAHILTPQSGLYSFVPLTAFGNETSSVRFCEKLLADARIASVPGIAFGKEGYVRFAFGEKEEELRGALHAFEKVKK